MGKNGLKLRVKKLDIGYAVQQRFRQLHVLYWKTLAIYNTPEECAENYGGYYSIEKSLSKLNAH